MTGSLKTDRRFADRAMRRAHALRHLAESPLFSAEGRETLLACAALFEARAATLKATG